MMDDKKITSISILAALMAGSASVTETEDDRRIHETYRVGCPMPMSNEKRKAKRAKQKVQKQARKRNRKK